MTMAFVSGRECMRAWEAMPLVLQQRAGPETRDWLQAHLGGCGACRIAFRQHDRLQLTLSLPSDLPLDADVGLRRLLDRIDASVRDVAPAESPSRAGRWQRALFAAALIQAGILLLGCRLWHPQQTAAYRTLSQEPVPATSAAGTIRVVPDSAMALTDWNALLHVLRLRVVGGPDAAGAYTVAPTSPTVSTRRALQQLRATRGVRLAEAVPGARRG